MCLWPVGLLKALPCPQHRVGGREGANCRVGKNDPRGHKGRAERCCGWGSVWGMAFNSVAPTGSHRLKERVRGWGYLESIEPERNSAGGAVGFQLLCTGMKQVPRQNGIGGLVRLLFTLQTESWSGGVCTLSLLPLLLSTLA